MNDTRDTIEIVKVIACLVWGVINLLIIIVGLLLLPYFIWQHYEDQKRRSAKMALTAKELGMQLERALDPRMDKVHRFLRKVKGSRRYALNVISGESQGHSVTIFEYHYQRYFRGKSYEFGKYIEHHYLTYLVLDLNNEFPELTVKEEKPASQILSRIADALGRGDIDFEAHEFSERYDVRSSDKKFAYDFCNTKMMEYLLEKTTVPIEVEKEALAICFPDRINQSKIEAQLEHLVNIRTRMPGYLFAA
jgi:hypothetical protein